MKTQTWEISIHNSLINMFNSHLKISILISISVKKCNKLTLFQITTNGLIKSKLQTSFFQYNLYRSFENYHKIQVFPLPKVGNWYAHETYSNWNKHHVDLTARDASGCAAICQMKLSSSLKTLSFACMLKDKFWFNLTIIA